MYSYGPTDSKKVSYVGLQCQNYHQDTQNPPKSQFLDILDLPDHPDGDKISQKLFLCTPMVPRIPKRYHMWGHNVKTTIKTPIILQNPSFWTFLTFLIILMVTKYPRNYFYVLLWSQGFQKCAIRGVSKNLENFSFWKFGGHFSPPPGLIR